MRGSKAKIARSMLFNTLQQQGDMIPAGDKKFPWGQVINPRRRLYKDIKNAIKGAKFN